MAKNLVSLPVKEFEEEHERLPRVLRSGSKKFRNKEAAKQAKELRDWKKKHPAKYKRI